MLKILTRRALSDHGILKYGKNPTIALLLMNVISVDPNPSYYKIMEVVMERDEFIRLPPVKIRGSFWIVSPQVTALSPQMVKDCEKCSKT